MAELPDYWPKSLAHLSEPYDNGLSDHIVVAEISDASINGYKGCRLVTTALIPIEKVDDILKAPGGIGYEVRSWGPHPNVGKDQVYDTNFWIDGRTQQEKFQTIINAWNHHNRQVVLPDNIMLMTYGLVPRYLADGVVCWDDPRTPVYDVLRVKAHVNHDAKGTDPLALVVMRRDYLEDYCSLKGCAAVATFYEERFSSEDETIEALLNGKEGAEFKLPGRLLGVAVIKGNYHKDTPQMCRIWGCRLILAPTSRPITDAKDPALIWPSDDKPMTLHRAAANWIYGYVSDAVLCEYESKPEFDVHPDSGGVCYGGWWGVGFCDRIGRNHIRLEIKKLYEGNPPHVIAHWHRFAVAKEMAESDRETNGDVNIAIRAKAVVDGYLAFTNALEELSNYLGAGFTQKDIGSLDTNDVDYVGWWTVPALKSLGLVARPNASREQYLARTISVFQLLENLREAPLRNLALALGVPKEKTTGMKSLKLLATVCQLAVIAEEHGYHLVADAQEVVKFWNADAKLGMLNAIFALNALRICAAHAPGLDQEQKIADASAVFGTDVTAMQGGWGRAIDNIYDLLAKDLVAIAGLLEKGVDG